MNNRNKFYTILLLSFIWGGCSSDSNKRSVNKLDTPDPMVDFGINSIDANTNIQYGLGVLVSPDDEAQNSEYFDAKFIFLDDDFNHSNEDIQEIKFSIFDHSQDLIITNVITSPETIPVQLWDVSFNNEPYYGEFSYVIEVTSKSYFANFTGTSFSMSCELIVACCRDEIDDCSFLDDEDWGWNSENNYSIPSPISANCCN